MKRIYYTLKSTIENGTELQEVQGASVSLPYSEDNLELAKQEAWNGEYHIEDDGEPEPTKTPTQLDIIEAQITYTAMMTDTLLEV